MPDPKTDTVAPKAALLRPRNVIISASALAVVAAAVMIWRISSRSDAGTTGGPTFSPNAAARVKMPALDSPPENLIKFASSDQFQLLPLDKQTELANKLRDPNKFDGYVRLYFEGKITLHEGQRAMGNIATARMLQYSREYANAQSKEEKAALVDKALAEKQQAEDKLQLGLMLSGMGQLVAGPRNGAGPSPGAVKDFVEKLSPQDRSDLADYLQALRDRIRQGQQG